jgi:hypothetical protein
VAIEQQLQDPDENTDKDNSAFFRSLSGICAQSNLVYPSHTKHIQQNNNVTTVESIAIGIHENTVNLNIIPSILIIAENNGPKHLSSTHKTSDHTS